MLELHVDEITRASEPLAAQLLDVLYDEGLIKRVDGEGRAVDKDGNFTEGEWDARLEKYFPNEKTPLPGDPNETPKRTVAEVGTTTVAEAGTTTKAGAKK